MTVARRNPAEETSFGRWIRNHPGLDSIRQRLSVTDSDYWIHQYRAHHDQVGSRAVDSIMLVELKTFGAELRYSQRDTLHLTNQLLRMVCVKANGKRRFVRLRGDTGEVRLVRCFGVQQLVLSSDEPTSSRKILWNGQVISEEMLVDLLRFDRDPDSPTKLMSAAPRRHHTSPKAKILSLQFPTIPDHE